MRFGIKEVRRQHEGTFIFSCSLSYININNTSDLEEHFNILKDDPLFSSLTFGGITMRHYAEANMSEKSITAVKYTMKMMANVSETVMFMFLGLSTVVDTLEWQWDFIFFSIIFCIIYRVIGKKIRDTCAPWGIRMMWCVFCWIKIAYYLMKNFREWRILLCGILQNLLTFTALFIARLGQRILWKGREKYR